MGEHCMAWECPNFLLFGDIGVLIVSPLFNNLQDTDHAPRGAVSYTTWEELDVWTERHISRRWWLFLIDRALEQSEHVRC